VDQLPIYSKENIREMDNNNQVVGSEKTYAFNSLFGLRDEKVYEKWYYGIFNKANAEAVYIVTYEDKK